MNKKWWYVLILLIPVLLIVITALFLPTRNLFMGLSKPKAIYAEYKIYDVVEQKGLACAEAVEFLGSDGQFDYYFPCLKSSQIYFVSDEEVITVHEAYSRGIINLKKLYELDIVDRMVKLSVK